MDPRADKLIKEWHRRNIRGLASRNKEEASGAIVSLVPPQATIGISGSVTLGQMGLVDKLSGRGNKIIDQYQPGISKEESLRLRREGANADYYLASPNAIAETGELVFFSAWGNRTSGISNAGHVILIAGTNKIVPDLGRALDRSRTYATPLNCKRLKYESPCLPDGVCRQDICYFPGYKRMCCQVLIIEAEITPGRLTVMLVDEPLGF